MAPSFLSKLVKVNSPTNNRERRPSETSPRTSVATPRSRSRSTSRSNVISPTTPTQASTLSSKDIQISTDSQTISVNKANSRKSFDSTETSSTWQPNVTIVPPSPLVQGAELSDDDYQEHITTSVSTSDTTPTSRSTKDVRPSTPTTTATPTSPNPNLNTMSGRTNPAMASNASLSPGTFQIRKKSSNQSIKSVKVKKVPSNISLNVNHSKAATAPAEMELDSVTKAVIVESPTDINPSLGSAGSVKNPKLTPRSLKSKKSANGTASSKGSLPYMSISPARSSANGTVSSKGSRPRKSSVSVNSDNGSEHLGPGGDEVRPEYYSGLEDSSDEDDSGSELDSDDLELGDDDIPVTGFAVASNKRNADFHELFPTVPEGDYLIEDYGCALQREILIQGRLYISENHICFHANIFGWITDLSIPIHEITTLEKKMTAFVIPNAIQLSTRQAKYTFASFLSRDTTFDVIYNIWRLARPEDAVSVGSRSRRSIDDPDFNAAGSGGTLRGAGVVKIGSGVNGSGVALMRKATLCACSNDGKHHAETALDAVIPGTPDRIHNLMFASGFMKDFMAGNQKLLDIQMSDWSPVSTDSKLLTRNMSYIKPLNGSLGPKQTKCEITDEIVHLDSDDYISTATTTRTPEVPSGGVFSVKTRTCVMWAGPVSSRVLVTTHVEWTGRSFIKGIIERSAIDGQKVYHSDLEKAMRVYIQEHQSEFLPEGVDPVVINLTAGLQETNGTNGVRPESPTERRFTEDEFKQRERERNQRGLQWAWDTFEGASQVAKQSTKGALELIRDAWDQSSSTTILWFVIVILVFSNLWTLMRMGASRDEVSRRLEARKVEEREKWVQSIVTALWEELANGKKESNVLVETMLQHRESLSAHPTASSIGLAVGGDGGDTQATVSTVIPVETPLAFVVESIHGGTKRWEEAVHHLHQTLDVVEERVKAIRESLVFKHLDSLD